MFRVDRSSKMGKQCFIKEMMSYILFVLPFFHSYSSATNSKTQSISGVKVL